MNDKYTICDVHLPNSEDFAGFNDVSLSVALGFTAHVVQKISYIINIPPRYPIIHYGSRSKIIDHIADHIPDKDREYVRSYFLCVSLFAINFRTKVIQFFFLNFCRAFSNFPFMFLIISQNILSKFSS